ncbi:hypothetical protein b3_0158 [Synechococcus phage B3]|nr:hypothetical protein b3_0158 [Synechococcus phage B3]QGT54772.1 hypothetical protein b23_0157 [Synechococcus phage B23]
MYTEIYVNVDLKIETPENIINTLKAMCDMFDYEKTNDTLAEFPQRWHCLFSNMSYYTPSTYCRYLNFDNISHQWSLLGKGDIKNYDNEIEQFFTWIMPWVDGYPGDFIGYSRYEESKTPKLYFIV